ncbi:hypothetical protein V1277_000143 [Bradyrhizobium sp. AZCC 1588]
MDVGLPLIEMGQQRSARFAEGVRANTFQHQRKLVSAKGQFVTTPNNDTLYSQAWLNLEKGPVIITVPDSAGRYYCIPFMDMYTNNFAMVGTRTSGNGPRSFMVVGPHDATLNPMVIRSPTNWVWVLGRTLVDSEDDLPRAHAFQDGWQISGAESSTLKAYAGRSAPWSEYFASVQELMNESPPPVTDIRILDSMAPLLRLGGTFDLKNFSADQAKEIEEGISDAKKILSQARGLGRVQNGWTYPRSSLGNFGQDYDYRAAVALGGLGGLTRVEAMYFRALGPDSRGYDSARNWRLTFSGEHYRRSTRFGRCRCIRLLLRGSSISWTIQSIATRSEIAHRASDAARMDLSISGCREANRAQRRTQTGCRRLPTEISRCC